MIEHILSINIKARDKHILDNLIVTVESSQGDGSELSAVEIYSTEFTQPENTLSIEGDSADRLQHQFNVDCWLSPFNFTLDKQ